MYNNLVSTTIPNFNAVFNNANKTEQKEEFQLYADLLTRAWKKVFEEFSKENEKGSDYIQRVAKQLTQPNAALSRMQQCWRASIQPVSSPAFEKAEKKFLEQANLIHALYAQKGSCQDIAIGPALCDFEGVSILDRETLTPEEIYYLGLKTDQVTYEKNSSFDAWALIAYRIAALAPKIKALYEGEKGEITLSFLQANGFSPVENPQPGDLVVYRSEKMHFGILNREGLVISKLGGGEKIYTHKIWQTSFGAEVLFFRKNGDTPSLSDDAEIERDLQRGIEVSEDFMRQILSGELEVKEENGFNKIENHKIFKHQDYPRLIFKMSQQHSGMEIRYRHIVQAERIRHICDLNLLYIPHVKKFQLDNSTLLAEEFMDINPTDSGIVEEHYRYSATFGETARQLALFIAKTGFYDVAPRNVPILNEEGNRRVVLLDLEHMDPSKKAAGFFGGELGCDGLVGCLFSDDQIDQVIEIANQHQIFENDTFMPAKEKRLLHILEYQTLASYYQEKGLTTGKEPIVADLDALGLDLEQKGKRYMFGLTCSVKETTMRQVAEAIIKQINQNLENMNERNSLIGKRRITLNTNYYPMFDFVHSPFVGIADKKEDRWMWQILNALKKQGHIYRIEENNYGVQLQV